MSDEPPFKLPLSATPLANLYDEEDSYVGSGSTVAKAKALALAANHFPEMRELLRVLSNEWGSKESIRVMGKIRALLSKIESEEQRS